MIDFRYHLVSIIAIFFALATGIVLGAGPLSETIDDTLTDQTSQLRDENQRLHDQLETASEEHAYQEAFVNEVTPRLVADQLVGERVAVIAFPGADEAIVSAMQETLDNAGADAELLLRIDPTWTDPDSDPVLDQLATELVSTGTELGEGNGFDRGAAVLASAILGPPPDEGESSDEPAGTVDAPVVAAYEEAGLVQLEQDSSTAPTLAVAVAGPVSGEDADERYARLMTLANQLDQHGDGLVVAGPPSTAQDGLLMAIRSDEAGEQVSTVDAADLPSGRVAVVFALTEQQRGSVGHYGAVGDTDSALPPVPDAPETSEETPADEAGADADGGTGDDSEGDDSEGDE